MRKLGYALITALGILALGLAFNLANVKEALADAVKNVAVVNTPNVRVQKDLMSDGRPFTLTPDPNIAFEFTVPPDVVLTDVVLSLSGPSLATTYFVQGRSSGVTYVHESVGSEGSTWAGNTTGRGAIHLQSGLQDAAGFRVGVTCNNIGGNSCSGAIFWSGYVP